MIRRLGLALAVAAGLALGACEPPPVTTARFDVRVSVVDDLDNAVAGAKIRVGGHTLGITDDKGVMLTTLETLEGKRIELSVDCPARFVENETPKPMLLRDYHALDQNSTGLGTTFRCDRRQRIAALMVRAPGHAHLPVSVDGVVYGELDRTGVGLFAIAAEPATELSVTLATHGRRLFPRNPTRTFAVGDIDEVFVFDASLARVPVKTEPKKRPARRKKRIAKPEPEPEPERLIPIKVKPIKRIWTSESRPDAPARKP